MNLEQFKKTYEFEELREYENTVKPEECLLTVRVITYNHVLTISECLDSILAQEVSFKYQILLFEDDSRDGTRDICISYAKKYPEFIRLFLNSRANNIRINDKPTGLFNAAYGNLITNTDYLAIIEGDDYWNDTRNLQLKIDVLEADESVSFCFSDAMRIDLSTKKTLSKSLVGLNHSKKLGFSEILDLNIPTASLLFRNILGDYRFHSEMLEIPNSDFLLRAKLSQFGKGCFLKEITPLMRHVHNDGMFNGLTFEQQFEMMIISRKKIIDFFEQCKWNTLPLYESLCMLYTKRIIKNIKKFKFDISGIRELVKHSRMTSTRSIGYIKKRVLY